MYALQYILILILIQFVTSNWTAVKHRIITFKERANFPPAGDASFTCKLSQGRLQEKYWYSTANKKDHVGDEESTCRWVSRGWWLEWTGRIFPWKKRSAVSHQCSAGRVYSCSKYPNLTCKPGLNRPEWSSSAKSQLRSLSNTKKSPGMLSSKFCSASPSLPFPGVRKCCRY